MGIFVNQLGYDSYDETSKVSSLEPTMELSLQNILESEMNWNATMQAIYLDELAYKAQTGEEKLYSVNEAAGIFESIKNFFKKVWAKIKALFERFTAMFNSYTQSDSSFVNKYSKVLRKLTLKDFRCDIYEFTHLDTGIEKSNLIKALKTSSTKAGDYLDGNGALNDSTITSITADNENAKDFCREIEKSKATDYLRGLMLGDHSKKVSSSDYNNKLFKYFRDGKDTKKETKITSVEKYLKLIQNTSDVKDTAKENYDTFKDILENTIDSLDTLESKLSDQVDESEDKEAKTLQMRVTTKVANYLRSGIAILETWNGAQLKAIKDQNRQAKSICVKALSNGRKNEIKHESTDLFAEGGSFLSRVELI